PPMQPRSISGWPLPLGCNSAEALPPFLTGAVPPLPFPIPFSHLPGMQADPRLRVAGLARQDSFDEVASGGSNASAGVGGGGVGGGPSGSSAGGGAAMSHKQVRQRLQEVILNKQRNRELSNSPPEWASPQSSFESAGSPPTRWQVQHTFPLPAGSPLKDFPLRKTSSEPNLKVRTAAMRHQRGAALLDRTAKRRLRSLLERSGIGNAAAPAAATATAVSSAASGASGQSVECHASLPNLAGLKARLSIAAAAAAAAGAGGPAALCRPAESMPRRRPGKQLSRTRSAPLPMPVSAVKAQLRQKVLHRSGSADDAPAGPQPPGSAAPPPCCASHGAAPQIREEAEEDGLAMLERACSTPLMQLPSPIAEERPNDLLPAASGTALAYDEGMLAHRCLCNQSRLHPENPLRLELVWQRLVETGLAARCMRCRSRKATIEELRLCHGEMYSVLHATQPSQRTRLDPALLLNFKFAQLPCGGFGVDTDTVWIEGGTAQACRLAVGVLLELCQRIVLGDCRNGLALIRPPGHHAEDSQAMGFCYFNSVAIAARSLVRSGQAARVCIVDWDVHHGNGTQSVFYSDPSVLYISLHRYDGGAFFPGSGAVEEIGEGPGLGTNINIAWSGQVMGDAEYLAAFRAIVLPVVAQFSPTLLLVSAGFDAARGHPSNLGGYCLSPEGFAQLTAQLIRATPGGRIALALEGGYDLATLPDCVEACLRVLLGEPEPALSDAERHRRPNPDAVDLIHQVVRQQRQFWGDCLGLPSADTIDMSVEEATRRLQALTVCGGPSECGV
ncbi:hypothetical protein BOX15_Mlig032713g1, partial [Macrostomum lignano]